MTKTEETQIARAEFDRIWRLERGQAARDFPADPVFRRYRCRIEEFLSEPTYPPWYTDPRGRRFLAYDHPRATPIRIATLLDAEALRDEMIRRVGSTRSVRKMPSVIVEHCSGCRRRVVKDGIRGLLLAALLGAEESMIVTEVSGGRWEQAMFDMKVVCACRRGPYPARSHEDPLGE